MDPVPVRASVMRFIAEETSIFYFSMEFIPHPNQAEIAQSIAEAREEGIFVNPPPPKVRYWLQEAAAAGGEARSICSAESPDGLVADDRYLYFAEPYAGYVMRVARDGSEGPSMIARDLGFPYSVLPDRDAVYVSSLGGPNAKGRPASIVRIGRTSGSVTVIAGDGGASLAVDDTHVYWSRDESIWRSPKTEPGKPSLVTRGEARPSALKVYGDHVYFSDRGVKRARVTGGVPEVLAKDYVQDLAVDESGVYWPRASGDGTGDGGGFAWLAHGGSVQTFASARVSDGRVIALSPTHVYVMANAGMFRAAKPARGRA